MEITKKIFWREAMKGGTIIGLATVGIDLMRHFIDRDEHRFWSVLLSIVGVAVFVMLIYAFTKKISSQADPALGFPYAKCIGFTVCMMLFVGFLQGVYGYFMNNFIDPESAREAIDSTMIFYQDILPESQFDMMYSMMEKGMFGALYQIFGGILGYVMYGTIIGLITSAFAKKNPDIFAEPANGLQNEDEEI